MINRYNIVVGIAIRLSTSRISKEELANIHSRNGLMFNDMFPNIEVDGGFEKQTSFITAVYGESHQVTYDIVGKFKPSHDLIMECESDEEMIKKYFTSVIDKYFGYVEHEYQIFSLDHCLISRNTIKE